LAEILSIKIAALFVGAYSPGIHDSEGRSAKMANSTPACHWRAGQRSQYNQKNIFFYYNSTFSVKSIKKYQYIQGYRLKKILNYI
jgi:hypothetical protein